MRLLQHLVNAQVSVNRAVFEANRPMPSEVYILRETSAAIDELTRVLTNLRANAAKRRP